MMEIVEQGEVWVGEDDSFQFDHTFLIVTRSDEYYFPKRSERLQPRSKIEPSNLELVHIPSEKIWPMYSTRLTRAPLEIIQHAYIKKPSLLSYEPTSSDHPSAQLLAEAEICQILISHPHRNVAEYQGCVVNGGRVKGLCFTKYPMTHSKKLRGGESFDHDQCVREIADGIRHLHLLGIIHNDINPFNIMLDDQNTVRIIDLDSAKWEKQELCCKKGTEGWTQEGMTYAERENDYYGLRKISEHLGVTAGISF
jgi:serine/threonine protein kinase